ncbi:hypothetical protein WJX79_001570 [Trebouxia sp. C0005]
MSPQSLLAVSALIWLHTLSISAHASSVSISPVPGSPPAEISSLSVNTSAPAVNATVTTVIPPVSLMTSSVLTNLSLSSLGFTVGAAASQFNVSFPVQADNTTISPLATHNASIASFLPQNATQNVGKNNSDTLLVADPSWGAAIVVNASSLSATQLVVSNTTTAGSTTVFTTVYNTTTVVQNDNTQTTPWQHSGLNWFGFDDGNTGPDGLWAGSTSLTQDFANIMLRIKALGFNAVRLPFSFKDLNSPMKAFGRSCSFVSGSDLAASTVPGGTNVASGSVFPSLSEPPQRTQTLGVCSDYLDVGTTFNRLVYVVKLLTHNGFYVLLDNQFNLDTTVLDNQNQWLSDWVTLLKAVAQDSISSQMLMIDVLNEPDVFGVRWEAANGKPGYADLCIQLMDAVYSIVPGALFFVEGTGQYAPGYDGLAFNYGDGLASSSAAFDEYRGISDAGLFFEQVLSKPYLSQVVAAPHVYPPSISEAHDKYTGSGLFNRLSLSFGYLNKQGYCSRSNSNNCHQFPVVIGETGTTFALQADQQQMADFALYLNNQGAGNDGQHNAISSWFWWAWNANSGDTGGIVEADWTTINWTKINYMISIGLNPWYSGQSAAATPAVPAGACSDTPPNSQYTCAQQAGWGKCTTAASCADIPPNNQYTCAQQAGWGKCNEAFMSGFCAQSCNRCSSACTDTPPNSQYSCQQQAGWGKCNEAFITSGNFCQITCGRCSACSDNPPDSVYTCAQQVGFGKCKLGIAEALLDQLSASPVNQIYIGHSLLLAEDTSSSSTQPRAEALHNSGLTLSYQVEVMSVTAPWRSALLKSLDLNKELKYSTFFQLATVRPNGKPANRTMVYRGFVGESTKLTFTTDSRSSKMDDVKENPWSEICWYMPESREQYRLSGKLYIIKSDEKDAELKKIWHEAWSGLSTGGRGWFTWPDASQPRTENDKEFEKDPPGQDEDPLSNYCLCVLDVFECELSKLREKLRIEYHSKEEGGKRVWTQHDMNP